MFRRTTIAAPLLAALLLAAGCDAPPTAPAPNARPDSFTDTRSDLIVAPLLVAVVPGQVVRLERSRGVVETAFIQAHVVAWGGTEAMDGAILVVSAADGPMPQTDPDAEWLRVRIERGTFDEDGTIVWEGTGTLRGPRGERTDFPIAGSGRPVSESPDEILWEISGSNVYDGAKATVEYTWDLKINRK